MKISSLLCFSFICVFLEARPDDYSPTSETESKSVEIESRTTEVVNETLSNNVERNGKKEEMIELLTLLPELKAENDDSESDNASDSDRAEIKDESSERYGNNGQIILDDMKRIETPEIIKREDRDGKSNENIEVRRMADDDDSKENTSEERSEESSEEEISELEQPALLQNTRRMISYPTEKPVDVVTLPGDLADQNLESRAALGLTPRISRLPLQIPKVITTPGLPNPFSFTTPIPYSNPIKLQNYPNAGTYLKRFPLDYQKSLPGMLKLSKSDFPRPGTPLIDDFAAEAFGNAYPFISSTSAPLDIFPQDIFPKNLYSKLMQASEHPVPYQPGLYSPFRNTGYPNTNFFLGQKDLKLRPHTLKRNL